MVCGEMGVLIPFQLDLETPLSLLPAPLNSLAEITECVNELGLPRSVWTGSIPSCQIPYIFPARQAGSVGNRYDHLQPRAGPRNIKHNTFELD